MPTEVFPLIQYGSNPAIIDGDRFQIFSYEHLNEYSNRITETLTPVPRALVFLFCQNQLDEAAAYASLINSPHVVCLLDGRLSTDLKNRLIALYQPNFIMQCNSERWENYAEINNPFPILKVLKKRKSSPIALHPDLKLLLSTSGTTGSPKMIRLSVKNILSNAQSIISYLGIRDTDKAIASLPLHYSYGLSILHTHLFAGGAIVLTQYNVMQQPFWDVVQQQHCTSFAGVPYMYEMLEKIHFGQLSLPLLKTMTQAGGHLDKALVIKFSQIMKAKQGKFFVMYGQTEATARIAYLPPHLLPAKAGAIGIAIPEGQLCVMEGEVRKLQPGSIGELVYFGPNVMMGYAEGVEDLSKGDLLTGMLRTEDQGYFDADGIFYVTGRKKRISKVYGSRINLDEVELLLKPIGNAAVVSDDQRIYFFIENGNNEQLKAGIDILSNKLKLHPSTFKGTKILKFPLTASGKIDYVRLQEQL